MITQVLSPDKHPFEWIDISDPDIEDFSALKEKYNLNAESIRDCLEIGHLPKIEEFDNYHFLIIRTTKAKLSDTSDSLIDITDRVSIFYGANFVITAHRNEIPFLENIKKMDVNSKTLSSSKHLINTLVSEALKTFETLVLGDLDAKLDEYEEIVFLHQRRKPFLKKLYYIKRQIDVIRSVLILYKDIVDYFHLPEYKNIYTQDLRDLFSRTNTLYRNIGEKYGTAAVHLFQYRVQPYERNYADTDHYFCILHANDLYCRRIWHELRHHARIALEIWLSTRHDKHDDLKLINISLV